MKWLLVVLVFEVLPDGSLEARGSHSQLFRSETECNETGRNFRALRPDLPDRYRSVSVCIPEDAFEEEPEPVDL